MAKIENDSIVLSEDEIERLLTNLLHPTKNPYRENYMKRIDALHCKETEEGFSIETDISI